MEQKLDALQKQTAANTAAAAKANAKADAKVPVSSANAAIPVKAAVAPSGPARRVIDSARQSPEA
jgi:phosphate-selective porin OprO/OprP